MSYSKWAAKQKGNPIYLGVAAVLFVTGSLVLYRGVINPWIKRRRLENNEAFAQMIIENEKKKIAQDT